MHVRLIIPCKADTDRNPQDWTFGQTVQAYGPQIADIAGGFTATQGTGGWKDQNGELVVEPIAVFDCNVEPVNGSHYVRIAAFYRLAERIARELSQDCVYLAFDGEVEFVKPE